MKFDYCIGNPPYNEDFSNSGDNGNYAAPVYNDFLDATYEVGQKVEMIHPARFLFNAGSTSKKWNKKMLNDKHFKVLHYEPNSDKIFPALSTPLKGGVAITYRDSSEDFGTIGVFSTYQELNPILQKVLNKNSFVSLDTLYNAPESYRFTKDLYNDFPKLKEMTYVDKKGKIKPLISKGHDFDLATNILEKLDSIIFMELPKNKDDIQVIGRKNNERVIRYINKKYLKSFDNLYYYKIFLTKVNGTGQFGETLSQPILGCPNLAHTQTFISFGKFETEYEAENLIKYIKTKMLRCLLSSLKVTQDNKQKAWHNIPLQNFTKNSDIDWSQSISDIDKQLYKKYGLSEEEINFIETHVKEME